MDPEHRQMLAEAVAKVMVSEEISVGTLPDETENSAASKFWRKVLYLLPESELKSKATMDGEFVLYDLWRADKEQMVSLLKPLLPKELTGMGRKASPKQKPASHKNSSMTRPASTREDNRSKVTKEAGAPAETHTPDLSKWLAEVEARLMQLAEEKVSAAMEQYRPQTAPVADIAVPPRPRTREGSRELTVKREKLQGTCDKALFELFESDRKARGFNVSQMIDVVLYNFYGKPPLSFETTDAKDEGQADE